MLFDLAFQMQCKYLCIIRSLSPLWIPAGLVTHRNRRAGHGQPFHCFPAPYFDLGVSVYGSTNQTREVHGAVVHTLRQLDPHWMPKSVLVSLHCPWAQGEVPHNQGVPAVVTKGPPEMNRSSQGLVWRRSRTGCPGNCWCRSSDLNGR